MALTTKEILDFDGFYVEAIPEFIYLLLKSSRDPSRTTRLEQKLHKSYTNVSVRPLGLEQWPLQVENIIHNASRPADPTCRQEDL